MMKMTLIARIADGLPLAEGLYDGCDLQDKEMYKKHGMSLVKNLKPGYQIEALSEGTGNYVCHYITEGNVFYLTVCHRSYERELAIKYLKHLKTEFELVDGAKVETASRPYEFGIFTEKNNKLYQKEIPSLVDLCLKNLTGSLRDVDRLPEHLLKRFLAQCSMEQLIRIEINTEDIDISSLTDPLWEGFYEIKFGSKETERVHQNLGRYDTTFKWSEFYHERLCSEGTFNRYPFTAMDRKVRRRTKLVSNIYTRYEEVTNLPGSPILTPASTSQQDMEKEKKTVVYDITTKSGVNMPLFIDTPKSKERVEIFIICPPSQDYSFVDQVMGTTSASITQMSILPEGRLYRVCSHEAFGPSSPSTQAVMQLYEGFRTYTQCVHEISLIVKEQSIDLKLWAIVNGAEMFDKHNGDTVVKISGSKFEVHKSFKRLIFLLRRGFFTVADSDANAGFYSDSDADPEADAEDI